MKSSRVRQPNNPVGDKQSAASQVTPQGVALILGIGTFLALFSDTAMYIVLPVNMEKAGIVLGQVGLMLAANRLVRIPLNGPGGLLIERLPRRRVLLAAQLIGVVSSLCYLLAGFWPLLIGRMLWGISWIGLWIGGSSALLDVAPAQSRGNLSGRFHLWIFAGFAGGSLVGGLLNDWLGYDGTFIACAGLGLLAFLYWWWKLPETTFQHQITPSIRSDSQGDAAELPIRRLPLITAMLIMALNWMIYLGFISTTLTLLLREKVGEALLVGSLLLPLTTLSGAAFAGKHVISMVASPLTGKISDHLGDRWRMIAFSLLLGSVTLMFAARAEGLLVIAGILPGAITNSILQTQSTALIGDLVPPRRRPRVLGWFTTVADSGSALGPLLAYAFISNGWSISSILLLAATLLALMLPWTAWIAFRERRAPSFA